MVSLITNGATTTAPATAAPAVQPVANGRVNGSLNGGLKRKHRDVESSDADDFTNAVSTKDQKDQKRRRVTFDPDVDVHILPDVNEKSLELVGEEVRRALEKHATDDNAAYDTLRALFAAKPTQSEALLSRNLEKYVIALTNNVQLLDPKCRGLVHAIIDCSWVARNDQFYRSYRTLLRSLLSIHPGFTGAILNMLVAMFVDLPSPSVRGQDDPSISRAKMGTRVHEFLKHLLRQIHMTSTLLGPVLASNFPFPTDSTKAHVQYIRNMLKVSEYCPELKGEIHSVVMDKLVKIDVQIQIDMDELEEDIEEGLIQERDDYDNDDASDADSDISDDESVSSDESLAEEDRRLKEIRESVQKLDAIMDLLFTHYATIFDSGTLFQKDDTFESLLSQFANIILPNLRSRHTQFLLFHFSQTSPELTERFAGCCSHLAFDQRNPELLRIAAAAYLASFIARGAHVSAAVVRDVFDLLCHHLETLRNAHEAGCKAPDKRRYGTYYAIAQSLLYMFCFRWRDLIVTDDGLPPTDEDVLANETDFEWHGGIQSILHQNIISKLNPLKICAPTIVAQFARMAHHLKFLYVYSKLETNKRVRLARSIGGGGGYMDGMAARETALSMKDKGGDEGFLLDAYFPFDPYVLPRSRRWLVDDYVEWRPVPGMARREEDEDDEEDSDEDEGGSEEEEDDESSGSEMGEEDEDEHAAEVESTDLSA